MISKNAKLVEYIFDLEKIEQKPTRACCVDRYYKIR